MVCGIRFRIRSALTEQNGNDHKERLMEDLVYIGVFISQVTLALCSVVAIIAILKDK